MGIKLPDWEVKLVKFITDSLYMPFEWGKMDCTTFAVDCIAQVTDKPLTLPDFTYTNREEAILFSQKNDLYVEMLKQLNAYEVPTKFQAVGDIILIWETNDYPCVHICIGSRSVSALPNYGVRAFDTKLLIKESAKYNTKIMRFD